MKFSSSYAGALGNPQFALLLSGRTASSIAYSLFAIQGIWQVMALSNSDPWYVSAFALSATLPFVVFGLFAGIGADRWNKKRVMTVVEFFAVIICALLFFQLSFAENFSETVAAQFGETFGKKSPWFIIAANALLAIAGAFSEPCYRSVLPWVVKDDHLNASNALLDGFQRGSDIIVPLSVGAITLLLSPDHLFIVAAACYLVSALCYAAMRRDSALAGTGDLKDNKGTENSVPLNPMKPGFIESYRFLAAHPAILLMVACSATNILLSTGAWRVGLPLLVKEGLAMDMAFYAKVLGCMSGAQLVTILVFGAFKPVKPMRIYAGAVIVWGLSLVAIGLFQVPTVLVVASMILASAQSLQGMTRSISIQKSIPREKLGRVFSFSGTLNYTADTISLPLASLLFPILGAPALIASVGCAIFFFGSFLTAKKIWTRDTQPAGEPPLQLKTELNPGVTP